jgi:hypothetical protein
MTAMGLGRSLPIVGFLWAGVVVGPNQAQGAGRGGEDLVPSRTDSASPPESLETARRVDEVLRCAWTKEGLSPAPRSGDAEFFRRVHLDLAGAIPRADEVAAFLADASGDKRERLVDRLLDSEAFARHWSTVLSNWTIPREPQNPAGDREAYRRWLEERLASAQGWDEVVRSLLTASGSMSEAPAVAFFAANGPTPQDLAGQAAKLFLGIQVQCAQCHDHPFTDWKQDDFWGLAAFFSQVKREKGKDKTAVSIVDQPAKAAAVPKEKGKGKGAAVEAAAKPRGPRIQIPETKKVVEGKFLDGTRPGELEFTAYRTALADWITSPHNAYFPRATVNRLWAYFFQRGFVEPVDDFLPDSECVHPEALGLLSRDFVTSGFRLRFLIGAIVKTEAYQLTTAQAAAEPAGTDKRAEKAVRLFAALTPRALSPEQLYDSIARAQGTEADGAAKEASPKTKDGKGSPQSRRDRAVAALAAAENPDSPQRYEGSIPVALFLMNGGLVHAKSPFVEDLLSRRPPPAEVVDALFLTALSRPPDPEEREHFIAHLNASGELREATRRAFWSLLNTSEFALNH